MKSKEEILARKRLLIKDGIEWVSLSGAKDAMEEYHQERMREELINFQLWLIEWTIKNPEKNLLNCNVDEYLKQKP